jgi:hypothetical protein
MWKAIVASAAFVLIISSGAMGENIITQNQGLQISTQNVLDLMHGQQDASSAQNLVVNISQNAQGGSLVFGSVSVIGMSNMFGRLSAMSSTLAMGHTLMSSGLVSPFCLQSLNDQAKLYALMLSGN